MKQWYLFYTEESGKLKQPVSELQLSINQYSKKLQQPVAEIMGEKLHQLGGVLFF